jgi:hypothetical protein
VLSPKDYLHMPAARLTSGLNCASISQRFGVKIVVRKIAFIHFRIFDERTAAIYSIHNSLTHYIYTISASVELPKLGKLHRVCRKCCYTLKTMPSVLQHSLARSQMSRICWILFLT